MHYSQAVVTGGAGFIGSHLVDRLVAINVAVTVIDKADPISAYRNAAATYVKMDINDEKLSDAMSVAKPDVVFHLAAHVDDRASVLDPVFNARENILGTIRVCEAARAAGTKKIIFASTGVVYGEVKSEKGKVKSSLQETMTPQPKTPYAVSKLAGERYLHFYSLVHHIPYVALRLGNVYGPRQDGSKECGLIAIATARVLAGKDVVQNNDGTTTRDYVFVDDVVAAFLAAVEKDATGVFNIGTGVGTSTKDVCEKVFAACNVPMVLTPRPEIADAVKHVVLDTHAADTALDWSPNVLLDDGIAQTVAWYRDRQSATASSSV